MRRPGVDVPPGMLKITLHDVQLTLPSLCFCVMKVGPHWGRAATRMAAPKAAWDWEVSSPHCTLPAVKSDPCVLVVDCL